MWQLMLRAFVDPNTIANKQNLKCVWKTMQLVQYLHKVTPTSKRFKSFLQVIAVLFPPSVRLFGFVIPVISMT